MRGAALPWTAPPRHLGLLGSVTPLSWLSVVPVGLGIAVAASSTDGIRVLVAVMAACALGAASLASLEAGLLGTIGWLICLGTIRRLMSLMDGGVDYDPLLLVAPASFALLVVVGWQQQRERKTTRLTVAVTVLGMMIVIGALNPLQGSLATGVTGLLFMGVPILAFWVGRAANDHVMYRTMILIVVGALMAVIYAWVQARQGFPAWDARWITHEGYDALQVGGRTRPFASFSAASEYGWFLAVACVLALALALRSRSLALYGACLVCGVGVFFTSQRSLIFLVTGALAVMFAARRGWRGPRAVAAIVVAIVALPIIVGQVYGGQVQGYRAGLGDRQLEGLANPLDERASTLGEHVGQLVGGLTAAIEEPLGHGTGTVTLAAERANDAEWSGSTEQDPSNVAVALGWPGFAAFLAVLGLGLSTAYRQARQGNPSVLALAGMALLFVTLFQWLTGSQYAVASLPWLVLGWLDGRAERGTRA